MNGNLHLGAIPKSELRIEGSSSQSVSSFAHINFISPHLSTRLGAGYSPAFFPNAEHFVLTGGEFNITNVNHSAVPIPVGMTEIQPTRD
jgi:hypothetical protein